MRNGTPRNGPGSLTRVVEPADHHRVEHRIDTLDPLDGRVQ